MYFVAYNLLCAIFYHNQGQFGILQPLGIATFLQCNRQNKGGLAIAVEAFKRQQPQQLFKTTSAVPELRSRYSKLDRYINFGSQQKWPFQWGWSFTIMDLVQ